MAQPARVNVGGRPLTCKHCGHDVFRLEWGALDRPVLSGLVLQEGGHLANIYVCQRCGFSHMFFQTEYVEHREMAVEGVPQEGDCLACGAAIPEHADACPSCGWSWATDETESP